MNARRSLPAIAAALLLAGCASSPQSPAKSDEPTRSETAAQYNLQLGIAYLQQGNLPLAKEKLERAQQQDSRNPTLHGALALLNEKLGKLREADGYYRSALRLAPRNPDLTNNYAVFLCRTGQVDEGLKRFTDAARNPLYGTPWRAYANAGVCLRGAKRYDEAAKYLGDAQRLRPADPETAFQLGELELERGRPAAARDLVERHLAQFNATPDLLWVGVRAARAVGDRLAEERYARRLQRDFPDAPQTKAAQLAPRGGAAP